MQIITNTSTAKDLTRALLTLGFEQGKAPAHVPATHIDVDRRCARAMKCGSCGKRGLTYTPYRRGREYRAVAACRHCGSGEEM